MELFSAKQCRFALEKSKESTGRIVVWRLGVVCSYTMEATYCGSDQGRLEGYQVCASELLLAGEELAKQLLHFNDRLTMPYLSEHPLRSYQDSVDIGEDFDTANPNSAESSASDAEEEQHSVFTFEATEWHGQFFQEDEV